MSISPDVAAKASVKAHEGDWDWLNAVLTRALQQNLRLACGYDGKNDAVRWTATRTAERFEDNQTLAAYHEDATRALFILADALDREFLGLDDWRYKQRSFDLTW